MVLKEWVEVLTLYKEIQKCLNTRVNKLKWVGLVVVVLLFAIGTLADYTGRDQMFGNVLSLLGLVYVGLSYWRVRVLDKEFKAEYEQHGIAVHYFFQRERYLRYALFLRGVIKKAWSRDDIAKLRNFAETLRMPAPPIRIDQHPLIVFLLGLFAGALLDVIKQPENWKGGKEAILTVIVRLLLYAIFFLWAYRTVTFTIPNIRHQEIQRFLQWAEMDIEKQQSTDI
jgi:hypothetical protein